MSPHAFNPAEEAIEVSGDNATILQQLTVEEKVALCGGRDWWRTVPIRRGQNLVLPHIKVSPPSEVMMPIMMPTPGLPAELIWRV